METMTRTGENMTNMTNGNTDLHLLNTPKRRKRCDGCGELRYTRTQVEDPYAGRIKLCAVCRGRPGDEEQVANAQQIIREEKRRANARNAYRADRERRTGYRK